MEKKPPHGSLCCSFTGVTSKKNDAIKQCNVDTHSQEISPMFSGPFPCRGWWGGIWGHEYMYAYICNLYMCLYFTVCAPEPDRESPLGITEPISGACPFANIGLPERAQMGDSPTFLWTVFRR